MNMMMMAVDRHTLCLPETDCKSPTRSRARAAPD